MGSILSMLSYLMFYTEKLVACFTCAMLIACLISTILVILSLGIGLGYNYCFVDMRTKHKYIPAGYRYPGGPRPPYSGYERPMPWPRAHKRHADYSISPLQVTEEAVLPNLSYNSIETKRYIAYETTTTASVSSTTVVNITTVIVNDTTNISYATKNVANAVTDVNITSTETPNRNDSNLTEADKAVTERGPTHRIIPLNGLDILALLSKLKSENRNYSLQIFST